MFVTVPYLICGLFLIPLGYFVDKFGRRQTIIIAQGFLTMSAFLIFLSIPSGNQCFASTFPWLFFGFGLTVYYVLMYGSVSYLVRDHQTGTAYGFITCFQNIGSFFIPPAISYIHDSTINVDHGYFWTFVSFIILCVCSICMKIWLLRWDATERGGILQSSQPQADF